MKKLSGILTAIATPMKGGKIDYDSLERLVAKQIQSNINGFVIAGTTGESPTVKSEEKKQIFTFIKKIVGDKIPLVLGAGGNDTDQSKQDAIAAENMGADAVLSVVPYYNKPPQRGLVEHFTAIAKATSLPVVLYNVPSRTITRLEIDSIKKLYEVENIVGIKEASGDIDFAKQIRKECGKEFLLLSGDDGTFDAFMEAGGDGVISVASHIIPEAFHKREVSRYKELVDYLFVEANPIPLKMALYKMGVFSSPELRLPLVALSEDYTIKLESLLKKFGVIK